MKWKHVNEEGLPICMVPSTRDASKAVYLESYLRSDCSSFRLRLALAGAVLLRGFDIDSVEEFAKVVRAIASTPLKYAGGDARRSLVNQYVYTANDARATLVISPHNEMGYSRAFPELVFFYCKVAASTGGATPLTDGRKVLQSLSSDLLSSFYKRDIRYIQNLPSKKDFGAQWAKTWQNTFETSDQGVVEKILERREAKWCWKSEGTLHVEETVPAIITNKYTNEQALFCQADRWHASQITSDDRYPILRIQENDRYHHCCFSDGASILAGHLREMSLIKQELSSQFNWQEGDVLCVDNLLTLHGRQSYTGSREVYVAMGNY